MGKQDSGWRPKGSGQSYGDYEVWEYEIGPHEINEGEVDGDISFEDTDGVEGADAEGDDERDDE